MVILPFESNFKQKLITSNQNNFSKIQVVNAKSFTKMHHHQSQARVDA